MMWPGPSAWRDELCGKLTSNMTKAEWDEWVSPKIEYQAACPSLDVPADPVTLRGPRVRAKRVG